MYDVLIVGAGPGGLSAALYGARSNLKVGIIEYDAPGGKMVTTSVIENYPGFKAIDGPDLSYKMFEQIMELGVEYIAGEVVDITKEDNVFYLHLAGGEKLTAKSVIVASGTTNKTLGVPGESKYRSKGISWCAVCDGPLYRDLEVAVIGGGNSAIKEGMYLAGICKTVYIIHRREELRADPILQQRLKEYDNIKLILNTEVIEFLGNEVLEEIVLRNNNTNETYKLKVSGCFEYLGHGPATGFLQNFQFILNNRGFIVANEKMETAEPGLFAVGDVIEKEVRQIATAVNDGVIAALSASKYVRRL